MRIVRRAWVRGELLAVYAMMILGDPDDGPI